MSTIGTPYIALSASMQAFYERRGMWVNNEPAGMLATWLGERCPWKAPGCTAVYWTTPDGLSAMAADAAAAPAQAWTTYHLCAQFLRRLREAAIRAGGTAIAMTNSPATRLAAPSTPTNACRATPFEALRIPAEGTRARRALDEHVMRTVREFVDYSLGSEFQGDAP